jgi:hypothetical protein
LNAQLKPHKYGLVHLRLDARSQVILAVPVCYSHERMMSVIAIPVAIITYTRSVYTHGRQKTVDEPKSNSIATQRR